MTPATVSGAAHGGERRVVVRYRSQFANSRPTVSTMPMSELSLLIEGPAAGTTIALAHGAGAAMDSDWMSDMSDGLVGRGLRVVRFEFPYMQRRREDGKRRGPDRPAVLLDAWRSVVDTLAGSDPLIIGGKSMGGRIASMIADEGQVDGLVCMGYPFHPPRTPEKLRTAHLEGLHTPTLILQGTRDTFGLPEEVDGYGLAETIRIHWLEDGDHSFKPRVKSGRTLKQNMDDAINEISKFIAALG